MVMFATSNFGSFWELTWPLGVAIYGGFRSHGGTAKSSKVTHGSDMVTTMDDFVMIWG